MEKKLELKHISPYLPYGLKVFRDTGETTDIGELSVGKMILWQEGYYESFKPILRHLSDLEDNLDWLSQMKEDVNHFISFHNGRFSDAMTDGFSIEWIPQSCFDWLVKNHFDVFGLIPAGLAISYKDAGLD